MPARGTAAAVGRGPSLGLLGYPMTMPEHLERLPQAGGPGDAGDWSGRARPSSGRRSGQSPGQKLGGGPGESLDVT